MTLEQADVQARHAGRHKPVIPSVHGEDALPPDPWTVQLLFLNSKILKKDNFRLGG